LYEVLRFYYKRKQQTAIKAKYYTDELIEWTRSIIFYKWEINYPESKLAEAVRKSTVPDIAAK